MGNNRWKIGVMVAAAALFVLLAIYHNAPLMQAFDRAMDGWLGGITWFKPFSFLGNPSTIVTVCLVVIVLLLIRRSPRDALFIVLAAGLGYALNEGLKEWFARPRPDRPGQLESYSFPSGHAQMGLLYVSSIAIIAVRRIRERHWRGLLISVAALLIAGMGLSRIALGRHYATDVLAGWAAGTAYLSLLMILFSFWKRDRSVS